MEYSKFTPAVISDWSPIDKGQFYDELFIYDYMNGAAEIYKQYAFSGLYVRRYENSGKPAVTVEIFDMGAARDAFGIFSHVRSGEEAGIGQGSDDTGGVINFWKGKFFVFIHTEEETSESRSAMIELADYINRAIKQTGDKPEILKFLPQSGLVANEIRYARSFILLNMHYFIASENILNINSETEAVLALYRINKKESYLMLIRYPSKEQAASARMNFAKHYLPEDPESNILQMEKGKWLSLSIENEYLAVVFEAPTKAQARDLLTSVNIH